MMIQRILGTAVGGKRQPRLATTLPWASIRLVLTGLHPGISEA